MSKFIEKYNQSNLAQLLKLKNSPIPNINSGDTVSVKYKIAEGSSSRIQAFTGSVISVSRSISNYSCSIVVRKMSGDVGVERKFMLYSPLLVDIELLKKGRVRRAKLYYLRGLTGKASRIKEKSSNF